MIDLDRTKGRALGTSRGWPVHDLNELYCRTKSAQVEAERHGFAGMAAALADLASKLAREPGVDPAMVRALAGRGAADPGASGGCTDAEPVAIMGSAGPIRLAPAPDGG